MASNYFIATNPLENLKPVLLDGPELVEVNSSLPIYHTIQPVVGLGFANQLKG
jgi:hypothetical protein